MAAVVQLVPRVRLLTADDLGIGVDATLQATHASNAPDAPRMAADHPKLALVRRLLLTFGGVIFTGPPGTGKTFYASQIAEALAGDKARVRFVQFHASYQYDDFMEGFVPAPGGGFDRKPGIFKRICEAATKDPEHTYVLVIDELSRADAARVFGEALTYVERSKRGLEVALASGESLRVPENLEILATMNPIDRGVDEVDAAFERRFAKIKIDPDRAALEEILDLGGVTDPLRSKVLGWFHLVNGMSRDNPAAAIGHAYFINVDGPAALRDVWEYQLQFAVDRAFRLDPETRRQVESRWETIFAGVQVNESGPQQADDPAGPDDAA
ncbi:McrB family protein [Rathayibacter sp. SD072]|uniref:McrB family protein n=1 Tax=Rathayibacter sp. SD072 TaxID=2781731 RepID=UPI001A962D70|nr:AAA family ATPase [Rathayibacter sp. SD072]MBO0985005.1 AAA family ATPase [Rathayibacter sp. SD072]